MICYKRSDAGVAFGASDHRGETLMNTAYRVNEPRFCKIQHDCRQLASVEVHISMPNSIYLNDFNFEMSESGPDLRRTRSEIHAA